MADSPATATAPEAERKSPAKGEVVTEIPGNARMGFWATEFEWFKANAGQIKKYSNVSPTTASYLRKTYGLEAVSRNTRDKRCDLYVKYDPATAEAIKNKPVKPRKPKAAPAAAKA